MKWFQYALTECMNMCKLANGMADKAQSYEMIDQMAFRWLHQIVMNLEDIDPDDHTEILSELLLIREEIKKTPNESIVLLEIASLQQLIEKKELAATDTE